MSRKRASLFELSGRTRGRRAFESPGAGGDSYSSSSSSYGATTTNNAHGNRGRRGGAKHAVKSHSSHDFQSEFRSGSSDSDSDKTEDDDDQVSQSSSSDEFTH